MTQWNQPGYLDTLAAAYAEAGDFESDVRWQTRAIAMLATEPQRDRFRSRLALCQSREGYRQTTEGQSSTAERP